MSATIIQQARAERDNYGDELFFERLNGGQGGGDSGWGDLEAPWDAESFDEAAVALPSSEVHLRLVSTLLKTVASSHAEVVSNRGGTFVRFDDGLSTISQHAANPDSSRRFGRCARNNRRCSHVSWRIGPPQGPRETKSFPSN